MKIGLLRTSFRFLLLLLLLNSFIGYAQTTVPFKKRYESQGINGELTIVGNGILGPTKDTPYHGTDVNNSINMVFVDIDNNASTVNSSSANFTTDKCNRIVYAGLYWGAVFEDAVLPPDQVKFKVPGKGYQNLTADEQLDLVYYKDVTSIVTASTKPNGDYFVANISTSQGFSSAAGWSLVIVYEDPNESRKYISSFDGFSAVRGSPYESVSFHYSGFTTPPLGAVEGKVGVAALEGDLKWYGDQMLFKADNKPSFKALYDDENDVNNFFNSKITNDGVLVNSRNLNSSNTLGWDQKVLDLTALNPGNSLIGNGETGVTVKVNNQVGGDWIYTFLNTFSINIIEPNLQVLTSVEDTSGNQITHNSPVALGSTVWYNINFQNIGTDNAQNTVVKNTLPFNVTLDESSMVLPAGVTYTYDTFTRELVFTIPNNLVERKTLSSAHDIRYLATASDQCFNYTDACTNLLENKISSNYDGETSGTNIDGQPGYNGINGCGLGTVGSMDLFVDTSSCSFDSQLYFCNNNLTFSGDDGYDTYIWTDESGTVIGNTKTITVSGPGTYKATQRRTGCTETIRTVFVKGLDTTVSSKNALCKDSNGSVSVVVNEASSKYTYELYKGASLIKTEKNKVSNKHTFSNIDIGNYSVKTYNDSGCFDITDFTITEPALLKLSAKNLYNVTTCNGLVLEGSLQATATGGTAPYEYSIDDGATYQAEDVFMVNAGNTYNITTRDANACIAKTTVDVGFDKEIVYIVSTVDIVCEGDSDGQINVAMTNNQGYTITYSLDNITFQASPKFTGLAKGNYELWVKKKNAFHECSTKTDLEIKQLNFLDLQLATAFDCTIGNIINATVNAADRNDVTYTLDGKNSNSTGIFNSVVNGKHTVKVENNTQGCVVTKEITVNGPALLQASSKKLYNGTLCNGSVMAGSLQATVTGGVLPYQYSIDGGTTFQSEDVFLVNEAKTYDIFIKDANGCNITTSTAVGIDAEIVYEVTKKNVICEGDDDGQININMTNKQGYTISYSLDGVNYKSGPNFTGLKVGSYNLSIKKKNAFHECVTEQALDIDLIIDLQFKASSGFSCGSEGHVITAIVNPIFQDEVTYTLDGTTQNTTGVFENVSLGNHIVSVKHNVEGCVSRENVLVEGALPLVAKTNVLNDVTTCAGSVLNGAIQVVATGGVPPYAYSIDGGLTYQSEDIFSVSEEKNYEISVKDDFGCSTVTSVDIGFTPEIEYEIIKDDIICLGDTDGKITIDLTNSQGYVVTYNLNGGDYATNATFSNLAAGTYQVGVKKENAIQESCEAITTVEIDQMVALQLHAEVDYTCEGLGNISATVDLLYQNEVTFTLDGVKKNTTGLFENVAKGAHVVTVEHNKLGCTDVPIDLMVEEYKILEIDEIVKVENIEENLYEVKAIGGIPDYMYGYVLTSNDSDDFDDYSEDSILNLNDPEFRKSANYTIYVKDRKECIVKKTIYIEYIQVLPFKIPDFFSPQNDGKNDTWYPKNIEKYENITVQVFDRYQRELVSFVGNEGNSWDGTYKGDPLPSGDYWYVIKLNHVDDGRVFKGNFSLVR